MISSSDSKSDKTGKMELFGFLTKNYYAKEKKEDDDNGENTIVEAATTTIGERKRTDLHLSNDVILEKKRKEEEEEEEDLNQYDPRSTYANKGSNAQLIALIFVAGMIAWFLLMKVPILVPSKANGEREIASSIGAETTDEGNGDLMMNDGDDERNDRNNNNFEDGEGIRSTEQQSAPFETQSDDDNDDATYYEGYRAVSRFSGDLADDVDFEYDDEYDGDEGVDSSSSSEMVTATKAEKMERQMDAAEAWLGEHHNKFFKNVVKELSMDESGWERAAKKQFAMRKEIIQEAAAMRKSEGYRAMIVLALEVATAVGALISCKNFIESDIYIRDVIDLRQMIPKIPDRPNLIPVSQRPSRPTAELVKKDISKLTTEELKAQLALLREQRN